MLTILICWLLADLLGGVVHFIEDLYLSPDTKNKYIRSLSESNEEHHKFPAGMTKKSIWYNIKDTAMMGWPIAFSLMMLNISVYIWLPIFFASFGNAVHRFAHVPRRRLNKVVCVLQDIGLFASWEEHYKHHYGPDGVLRREEAVDRFCPMTDWLNPIIDRLGLFKGISYVFKCLGIHKVK